MKRTMLLLSIFVLATLISGWVNLGEGLSDRLSVGQGA